MLDRHTSESVHKPESPQRCGDFFMSEYAENSDKNKSIVITGGPSTGKTTAIKHLKYTRPDIEYVDEAATMVLASGFPVPNEKRPWTQTWQNALQIAIAGMQLGLEAASKECAEAAIVQDRGLLDGASYLEGGVDEFEELMGMDRHEMHKRYHAVIYLGWLTARDYADNSNPQRFEDERRARVLSERVRLCWDGHPQLIEITTQNNRAGVIEDLLPNLIGGQA